jgi:hypothetical protein
MNPSLTYERQNVDEYDRFGNLGTWEIQDLDIREFRRVRNRN